MITKILSGGQSGADLAALDAALALGIPTGGWMTRGFQTEDGPKPEYRDKYGLRDVSSANYPVRTRRNVEDSQATLIVSGFTTLQGGTLFTHAVCKDRKKPVFVFVVPTNTWNTRLRDDVVAFLTKHQVAVLNVAGSRESKAPGIYQATYLIVYEVLVYMQTGAN